MLTKKEVVLDRLYLSPDTALFCPDPDEMEVEFPAIHIAVRDWEDMGRPKAITVTIVPGDMLNGD